MLSHKCPPTHPKAPHGSLPGADANGRILCKRCGARWKGSHECNGALKEKYFEAEN